MRVGVARLILRAYWGYLRAAIRSCVSTVSFPIKLTASPGAQDHWVPIAPPSLETATTATERSLPSRAKASCSCSTLIIDATSSSAGASDTAFGNARTFLFYTPTCLLIANLVAGLTLLPGPMQQAQAAGLSRLRQLGHNNSENL